MGEKANGSAANEDTGQVSVRGPNGRFLPGHPGAKPKGTRDKPRQLLKRAMDAIGQSTFLQQNEDGTSTETTYDEGILIRLADMAMGGDLGAIQIWMAYRFGRPTPMDPDKGGIDPAEALRLFLLKKMEETGNSGWNPKENATDVNPDQPIEDSNGHEDGDEGG